MQNKKLLIIGFIFPESKATAAGWRMLKLIEMFQKEYTVYFGSPATKNDNSDVLEGVERSFSIPINSEEANEILLDIAPDVVVFDRLFTEEMFGWRVAEVLPNALRVLNTEDLHFLRASREKWVSVQQQVVPVNENIELQKDLTCREVASILRSPVSLIISRSEKQLLMDRFHIPERKLFFLPLQLPEQRSALQDPSSKLDFCFIGNGIHKPNEDAIEQLICHIWPQIQHALPNAKLNIACGYTTSNIRKWTAKKKNIQLFEHVDDAHDFVQKHRVQLIPLRFGAGIKGKILETMICQTPFVTTPIGMEGISDDYSFVTSDWSAFATAAIQLYSEDSKFQQALSEMEEITKTYPNMERAFDDLLNRLQEGVTEDWFSDVLLQQQFNAARFLSKYIIEKNKSLTD